jgi:hypothetical protein
MGVFRKQGVFWIDYDADGHHTCERIGLDKRLAETVHRKHKVQIAKQKYLDNYRLITIIFDRLANAYFCNARDQRQKCSWT